MKAINPKNEQWRAYFNGYFHYLAEKSDWTHVYMVGIYNLYAIYAKEILRRQRSCKVGVDKVRS